MMTQRRRTGYILLISFLLNLILFMVSYYFKLPLWLDTTGTIYATMLCGFGVGFIVGLLNNLILFLFFYGHNSLFYYFVSLSVAFATGLIVRKRPEASVKQMGLVFCGAFLASVVTCVPLTILLNGGPPTDYWGQWLYHRLTDSGYHYMAASALAVTCIKGLDVIVSVLIVYLVFAKTPNKIRDRNRIIKYQVNV